MTTAETTTANQAAARIGIVERLVGETGEPQVILAAMREVAERNVAVIARALSQCVGNDVSVCAGEADVLRMPASRPTEPGHVMAIVAGSASSDPIVLTLDADTIGLLIDLAFGGDAGAVAAPIRRDLSRIELQVVEMAVRAVAAALSGDVAGELDHEGLSVLSGTPLLRHAMKDGAAVRVAYTISTPGSSGRMTLTVPQRLLLKPASAGEDAAPAASAPVWRSRFSDEVMRSEVRLEATMPLGRLTLEDLNTLQVGQVVEMVENAQNQARLLARGKTLFLCEFGKIGQNYTVRIRKPFDPGEDLIDSLVQR